MSLQDTREFLEDLFLRFDSSADLSDGSRIQTELIAPILARVGIDPIDESMGVFLLNRLRQARPDLALTEVDELSDLLIDPARILLEPIAREVKLLRLRGDLRNAEQMSDDEADALLYNHFVTREAGNFARGVVRAYFSAPQTISLSQLNPAGSRGGLRFFPTRPQQITADQMIFNRDGSEYYFDINYTAERAGDEYNLEAGEIISIANLPAATRVTNLRRFRDGLPRESTAALVARAGTAAADKTLTVGRGIIRTLGEAFPAIQQMTYAGFRDPEMQRDILTGGSLGPIPEPDVYGTFYGAASVVDDFDADFETPIVEALGGFFVSRVAAVGEDPRSWFLSISYTDGSLVVKDLRIVEVLSETSVRLEEELPTTLAASSITWALRQKKLTISGIPGGITLPDTAAGELELEDGEVHIGGRTDIYVAGETDEQTAQITTISDEAPLARGADVETFGTDIVEIHDAGYDSSLVTAGMSLVLEEGSDAGSYRIIQVAAGGPDLLRLDQVMTGTQGNLSWRIVDEIDIELTDPKSIKAEGADAVVTAENTTVTTLGATNFLDANVQANDILELTGSSAVEGDYTVTEVFATSIRVDPAPPRTVSGVRWRIFTRSEAVQAPIVRVKKMELLDSAGAPTGTEIPHRDPVVVLSRGFGNESSGFVFDGPVVTGLVTGGIATGSALFDTQSSTILWGIYDPDRIWEGPTLSGTFTLPAGSVSADVLVTAINVDAGLAAAGVVGRKITYQSRDYVAFLSGSRYLRFIGGSAFEAINGIVDRLGIPLRYCSASLRALSADFQSVGVRFGDLIEIYEGNNAVTQTRAVIGPETELRESIIVGSGPGGPVSTAFSGGIGGLYNNTVLNPDVGARARIARPSVGEVRTYFLQPTSAEFLYDETVFTVPGLASVVGYRPDPENIRIIQPPPPETALPAGATTTAPNLLTDTARDFRLLGIQPGDLLDLLYVPITGTSPLPSVGNVLVGGLSLRLRLRDDPAITISFPFSMPRQDVVDYINERVGEEIASLGTTGELQLMPEASLLELLDADAATSVLNAGNGDPLFLIGAELTNQHPSEGTYIIASVTDTVLTLSGETQFALGATGTQYRIRRYVQRISSTEMRDNTEAGLYYADVELIALAPGDQHNISSDLAMEVVGHRADGFRLHTDSSITSFSRAEVLFAELSRTILLPGSVDSPESYVQLSRQSMQVTYDRSELVDEVQSFVDSDLQRVVVEDVLVRHLLPNYVIVNMAYAGGPTEPTMTAALEEYLNGVEPNTLLAVTDLVRVLQARGATSIYVPDASVASGRTAPSYLVLWHDSDRRVRGALVRESAQPSRLGRWIPDNIQLRRLSASGIR
jgi:hypothetical protein